jgi:agmatinase
MEKICWANTDDFHESEFVIVGIPDESQSHALRQGTDKAPSKIREISNQRDLYVRNNIKSLGLPFTGTQKKIHDFGNIDRSLIENNYTRIIQEGKIPISIGGDHSITTQIVKTISKHLGKLSLVYFDAHPDFVSSSSNYYGSVLHDILPYIDAKSSIQIGIRTPEKEELDNIKKHDLKVITPFEIARNGIKKTTESILNTLGKNVYVSFDMDCIDPAYAPGVSVPVPMGLSSVDATSILKSISGNQISGMDIMEVCPKYDVNDRTSHLASRMIAEVIFAASLK